MAPLYFIFTLSYIFSLVFALDPIIPKLSFECPKLSSGLSVVYFKLPNELRSVQMWVSEVSNSTGPLYVYWHGTGNNPNQALTALGTAVDDILRIGGVVAAPFKSSRSGPLPWYLSEPDDVDLMDMIVYCTHNQNKIDAERIHALGYSAGGLITARLALERSKYIASVVTYSGGILPGRSYPFSSAKNYFATMAFYGGDSDVVLVKFKDTTSKFMKKLKQHSETHLFLTCNHNKGHRIPDEIDSVHQFFLDHPFGSFPSKYESDFPEIVPKYCVRSQLPLSEIPINSSCSAGYYFSVSEDICNPCPDFSESPENSKSINDCQCLPGYTRIDGACKACQSGTYKEKSGDSPCDFCPDYSRSPIASTSKYNCECIEGYTGNEGEECTACPINTFKNETGFTPCVFCPPYTESPIASSSINQCVCKQGFDNFMGESYECTAVSIAILGVTIGGMALISLIGAVFWFLKRTKYYQRNNSRRVIDEFENESLINDERL